jgi:hypothetical protein
MCIAMPTSSQRVSAVPLPERYALPGRPEGALPAALDAYRQTSFLLRDDLRLFEQAMELQLSILRDSSHSSFRKQTYAALVGLWSRTFLALGDACLLATRGSYASCPALVRAACEQIAAQHQLHAGEMELFLEWREAHFRPNDEHKAFDFGMGRYFAGETLAADERLRAVYRPASELARPNFGATALAAGPESNNLRLALSFADTAFHLGWAELVFGWLLALCDRQLAVAVHAADVFAVHDDTHRAYAALAGEVSRALARPDRCRIEEVDIGGYKHYLVQNFRRAPAGAAKRLLL